MSNKNTVTSKVSNGINELKNGEIFISPEEWASTEKKPEIVDLWFAVEKSERILPGQLIRFFPFEQMAEHGLRFRFYSLIPGAIKSIEKRLKELGVKYQITDSEMLITAY